MALPINHTNDLLFRAIALRKAIEISKSLAMGTNLEQLVQFPRGCCKIASLLLARYLTQSKGVLESSVFFACNGYRKRAKQNCSKRTFTVERHVWIELDGFILDITADQFRDQKRTVLVTNNRKWHSTFKGYKIYSYSSAMDFNVSFSTDFECFYGSIIQSASRYYGETTSSGLNLI